MLKIASITPHFGEEPPISGTKGSGTIFFSNCTMRCVYCQNYQISQGKGIGPSAPSMGRLDWARRSLGTSSLGVNSGVGVGELADEMLKLQDKDCHNINFVSPTQYAQQIVESLEIAKNKGLNIPIVYNTNGYDKISVLKMFDGLVDIYLPDIKYSDNQMGDDYSGVKNYVERNRAAIREMFRQVGNLEFDEKDIAKRGLLIRHLVLPEGIAGSYESLKFIASISKGIWLSIMAQYKPCFKAKNYKKLYRRITIAEYRQVLDWVHEFGFGNVLTQKLESSEVYLPDFGKDKPFESASDI